MRLIFAFLIFSSILSGCIGFIPVPKVSQNAMLKNQKRKYDNAVKMNNKSMLRDMCRNPFVYDKPPFQKWTDTVYSPKACAEIGGDFESEYASLQVQKKSPGKCISKIASFISQNVSSSEKAFEFRKIENLREMVSEDLDRCITRLETLVKNKEYAAFSYGEFGRSNLLYDLNHFDYHASEDREKPPLAEKDVKRLIVLKNKIPKGYVQHYTSLLKKQKNSFRKAYLHAALAHIYDKLEEKEQKEKHLNAFHKQFANLPTPKQLIKLSGTGPGSSEITKNIKNEQYMGVGFSNKVNDVLSFSISEPSYKTGDRKTTREAEKEIETRGTEKNPRWLKKDFECRVTLAQKIDKKMSECRLKHPSFSKANCLQVMGLKGKMQQCQRELNEIPEYHTAIIKQIQKYKYPAIEHFREASGNLTIRYDNQSKEIPLSHVQRDYTYDALQVANLSAKKGQTPTEERGFDIYKSAAEKNIKSKVRQIGNDYSGSLYSKMENASTYDEMMKYTIEYIKIHGKEPKNWQYLCTSHDGFQDIWKWIEFK